MKYAEARLWIVKTSLLIMAVFGSLLIISPSTKYPLTYDQAISVFQIILPLFVGYLSTAIVFLTTRRTPPNPGPTQEFSALLSLLVRGPVFLMALLLSIAFIVFGVENWPSTNQPSSGFEFGLLSNLVSFILSINAATTSALVAWLFKVEAETNA
jgi:hypothetical protein